MAKLIYSTITSLDGYVADAQGDFDWSVPDDEVHAFVNDRERRLGTYLYGRRLYEVMRAWETVETDDPRAADYAALWRATEKIVYSTTLGTVSSGRTRIERRFDAHAVREFVAASDTDVGIGGPRLAAHALAAGLVDELSVLASPVVVGGGIRFLPDGLKLDLELIGERRFGNGVVHLDYRVLR